MSNREPIHLYLSRYQEHLDYLRETGQETMGWREIREEKLPEYLQVADSHVQIEEEAIVRDYVREGSWKSGKILHVRLELTDGTTYAMHGYFIEERNDWFPNEDPLVHKSHRCGFCQSIIGLGGEGDVENTYCMLPLPEKKYLFERALDRHHKEVYKGMG